MARAIGVRAEAEQFHWAVVEGTREAPILVEHGRVEAPNGSAEALALSELRNRVVFLVRAHQPTTGVVRCAESNAPNSKTTAARRRGRLEGVVLEALNAAGVQVMVCMLATVSSSLGIDRKRAKEYLERGELRTIDMRGMPAQAREAILVGASALPEN